MDTTDTPAGPWTTDGGSTPGDADWFSASAAAVALGVSQRTIRRAIARGDLPATKCAGVYRIAPADLERYRARGRVARVPERAAPRDRPRLLPFPDREGPGPPTLPRPRTSLLGRDQEIDALSTLLVQDDVVFITLIGPGGIGKTQLALAVASRVQPAFPGGVWFVDLSALRDPSLVPASIAQALDLRDAAGVAPVDRLREYLATRHALLVLDNFEHLTAAAPAIATLLISCPRLAVLATSRVPLRVSVERRFPVRPLPTPEPGSSPDLPAVQELAAVRLFVRAAQTVEPGFALTAGNAATVAAICARLDGVPLAIELAAARCNVLSPAALLARLDHALPLLADGPRDVPDRLRTMSDAIAWSYDLLDAPDQHLLRRLAVFTGGFTEDAAAFVAGDADGSPSILPRLTRLVERSLLVATDADGQPRFTMLATIQEFSLEQLDLLGETAATRDRHAAWVLDLVERAAPWWHTVGRAPWLDTLAREQANLRAALGWLTQSGDRAMFVRLGGLVWPFWSAGFHWTEGSRWLRQAEAWSQGERTVESVRVRVGLGNLLLWLGDDPAAAAVLNEALVISDGLDTVSPLDRPDVMLGVAAQLRGDLDLSVAWLDRALAAHRALVDSDPRALPVVGFMINLMAWVYMHRDDVRHAETLAREALAIERRLGLDGEASRTLALLGFVAIARGQVGEGTRLFRESLDLAWAHRDLQQLVSLFTEHAEFDRETGHSARAAVLLGTGSQLRTLLGGYPAEWLVSIERLTDEIRAHLGDGPFLEHWQAGRDLPLDAAVMLARQVEIPPPPAIPAGITQRGITTREREVLCLLADGRTDQEIADTLFLSRRTVHTHVSHLLAKLGVPNRRQAIAVARAEHLLTGCPGIRP